MKGKIIVIEGCTDGIGKTTQFNILKERLIKEGYFVKSHHFPSYNTKEGALVESYLNGEFGKIESLSPYFINSLYAIDRAITWNMDLKKSYENGDIILLDRYTTSSLIYQSCLIDDLDKKKEFLDYVTDFEYNKLGVGRPDNVIFLTANYDIVKKQRENRRFNEGVQKDIHEKNDDFLKKVYENSLFVADYLSWDNVKCDQDDKMRNIDDIQKDVYTLVKKKR